MSGERLRCLLHLMGLAATLSAAKVILSTAGVALFLAKEGPERLPAFYIVLALVAVLMSAGFAGVVDRLPKIRLAQTAFLATLLGAAALRVPIALDAPGVYHALLASAHIYEIVTDIVFWLVVAAYLDTLEVRRGTSFLYMAVAAGGVAGGVFTSALAQALPAEDMLLALPVLGGAMVAQFALAERTCGGPREPDGGGEEEEAAAGIARNLLLLARIVGRYPLALLIALNALVLTVLYGLTEYLVFTVYAARFPDEGELTRFLAVVFALIQVLEFVLLYAVSRPLLGRTGPLVRNLVFPVGSLLSLVALASGARLPAAVGAHLNAEAVSNAVFQPVNNTNYGALPLRFQGRVRTLADGIFYPSGLALAGVMLLSLQGQAAALQVNLVAIVFALLFMALNVGVGVLFLPTLVRNLRSGVVHFEDVAGGTEALPAAFAERVRGLLRSDDPDDRAIGLGLAGRLDPAPILDELRALATRADRAATRRAIVGVLARARPKEVERLLDDLLDGSDERGQLVALQAKLARREEIAARHIRRLARSADRSVAALAALAAIPPAADGARPGRRRSADGEPLPPGPRDPDARAAVIEAIGHARRGDLADVLAAVTAAAPAAEQRRRGLAALRELANGDDDDAGIAALARESAAHADPHVRAEAVGLLGVYARSPAALEEVGRALEDPSRPVRGRAAEALAAHGDAATDVAAARLSAARAEVVEAAVRCLGRIGSRRAREALAGFLRPRYARAERCLGLLRRLPPGRDRAAWAAFEIAVHDRSLRVLDAVTDVLAALGEDRLVASLRRAALAATDRWTRASALEALACLPHRRLVLPILPLLEAMLVAREPAGERRTADHAAAPAPAAGGAALLDDAAADEDPWIRLGAARTARALGGAVGGRAAPAPGEVAAGRPACAEGTAITPTESDMERVLLLKRVPLFRYLPLDTLLAVGRVLERRAYVAGETVFEAGSRSDHFCIVESGAVEVFEDGRAAPSPERLVAPAWFGELVLVDEVPRSPRVVAAEDCALLRLHRIVFHDLSRDHPEVLLELCRLLARRLRQVQGGGAAILAR